MCTYAYLRVYVSVDTDSHTHMHFVVLLKGPRSNNTPVAMSTPSAQILLSI